MTFHAQAPALDDQMPCASHARPALRKVLGSQVAKVVHLLDLDSRPTAVVRPDVADGVVLHLDEVDHEGFFASLLAQGVHVVIGGGEDPADYHYYIDQCEDLHELDRLLALLSERAVAEGDEIQLFAA